MFYEWNHHPSEAFYCLNTPYPLKHHIFCVVGPYVLMIQHILFYYIIIFLLPYYCTNAEVLTNVILWFILEMDISSVRT